MAEVATVSGEVDVPDATESRAVYARLVLGQAVMLALLGDTLLRNPPWGIGWTIWVVALSITIILLVRRRGQRLNREQCVWLGAGVACAATFVWRDAGELQFVNFWATLFALVMLAMALARAPARSILSARLRDVFQAWRYSVQDALGGLLPLWNRDASMNGAIRGAAAGRAPILRAVLLTVPIVLLFGALLSSADPVFGSLFTIPGIQLDEVASHVFVVAALTWLTAGALRGALIAGDTRVAPRDGFPFTLGILDVSVVLGALNVLFAGFVGLQIRWLFGGAEIVRATTGLSLAEYARSGFFELAWVAALVFPLILVTRAAATDAATLARHQKFALPLLALLGAIMVSAVMRMQLYVAHFGLTTDRLYALVFMLWLALAFVCMAMTVLRGWARPFATLTIASGYLTLLALNAANPDAIVARVNLSRSPTARAVDYRYLASLSGDAAPIVAAVIASAPPSTETCKAATRLRGRWSYGLTDQWQWNFGAERARVMVLERLTPHSLRRLCGSSRT
jgi:hypothetical protein